MAPHFTQSLVLRLLIFQLQLALTKAGNDTWPQCSFQAQYETGTCCWYDKPGLQCPAAVVPLDPTPIAAIPSDPTPTACPDDATCTANGQDGTCTCESGLPPMITTITALPPEASTETHSETLTQGLITTTSREGSEEPTIVPIILPFKGPPIICWDCVKLPANTKIKTPEFCVEILGTTIGKCPPEDQPGVGSGSDSNKPDEPKLGDSEDTDEPDEPEESRSRCSSTITATYVSIFCTVTEEPDVPQRRDDEKPGCSSRAYSSIMACEDVQGSTTTTTTTVRPEKTELCMPDTCGAAGCSIVKRGDIFKRAPPRISEPEPGNWAEPMNYGGNTDNLVAGEVYLASRSKANSVSLTDEHNDLILSGTFQYVEFRDTPQTLAVYGLFGCTSVFVVSHRGAWGSHIWEGGEHRLDGILNILRGLRPEGAVFSKTESPHIFILTKRPRPKDANGVVDINGPGPTPDEPGDPYLVETIKGYLRDKNGELWGSLTQVHYQVLPYNGGAGQDDGFEIPRGKLLVQYRPALAAVADAAEDSDDDEGTDDEDTGDADMDDEDMEREDSAAEDNEAGTDCLRNKAQWRVWMEGAVPGPDRSDSWSPSDSQVFKTGSNIRRQEGCTIDSGDSTKPEEDSSEDEPNGSIEIPLPALAPGACKEQSDCPLSFCAGGGPGSSGTPTCKDKQCVCEAVGPSPAPGSCKEISDCPPSFCAGGGPGSSGTPTCKDKQCVCEDATAPPDLSCKGKNDCVSKVLCVDGQETICEADRCLCKDPPDLSCSQDASCSDKLKSCKSEDEARCKGGQCKCLPKPKFTSGICTAHIFEVANSKSLAVQIILYDGKGDEIHQYVDVDETGYDRTIIIKKDKLPYDVAFEFLGSFLDRRDRPEPSSTDARLKYQAYGIRITAGDTHWTTDDREENELPRCKVGGWDTHESWNPAYIVDGLIRVVMKIFGQDINDNKIPTRDMDCRWKC